MQVVGWDRIKSSGKLFLISVLVSESQLTWLKAKNHLFQVSGQLFQRKVWALTLKTSFKESTLLKIRKIVWSDLVAT